MQKGQFIAVTVAPTILSWDIIIKIMFRAIGFVISMYAITQMMSATFAAFEKAAVATFAAVETAAVVTKHQLQTVNN